MTRTRRRAFRPGLDELSPRWLPSGLAPSQLAHAYGLDAVKLPTSATTTAVGDGRGQTIALVEAYHDPAIAADLRAFDKASGLADPTLRVINLAGTATSDGWAGETALDVEWAHALAPGASILVVEARSDGLGDLLAAVDAARSAPGVSVVSMSWGGGEWSGETAYDYHFTTPAGHPGVTFVASTGDTSAYAGAEWPSTSPNVVAVGGTTLQIGASGIATEAGWYGSGGGYSQYEVEPAYQSSVQHTGVRTVPDVASDADPATGVLVIYTRPSTGLTSTLQVGGTSLSAPTWGALIAIVDQGRALSGKPSLDGASQALPAIYAAASTDFRDVTRGFNGYFARPGYDLVTGRGTPNAPSLALDLIKAGSASSAAAATSTPPKAPGMATVAEVSPTEPTTPPKSRPSKARHDPYELAFRDLGWS